MPNIALILAGGRGTRFNSMRPKQYIEVDGKPILSYTMRAFEKHPLVTDIYVVCSPEWNTYVEAQAGHNAFAKFRACIASGETSFRSMSNGIKALVTMGIDPDSIIMVHDAVRPLLSQDTITNNINVCREHGNAITVIYSNEAYMKVSGGIEASGFAMREDYMRAQTPHTFKLGTLSTLIESAAEKGISYSQSLFTLANELGYAPLYIAQGNMLNFKITQPQDLKFFRVLKDV
ncbi:MAG: 2-C-methyl-D-erythritol 4-phosphate cytidylyltransferase [Bacteroidaceae bacterium]|nr:2-C-methyl-D-erythritol 4-phosphate cytidylyltransferase [Bacteroidaceae bacterium]